MRKTITLAAVLAAALLAAPAAAERHTGVAEWHSTVGWGAAPSARKSDDDSRGSRAKAGHKHRQRGERCPKGVEDEEYCERDDDR